MGGRSHEPRWMTASQSRGSTRGTFSTIPMTATGPSTFEADIPAHALDSYVDYYISAAGIGGATATAPDSAPLDLYTFIVGTLVTVLDDDMETDIGWIDNPGGADTAIDGFWVLDDPNGTTDGIEQANPENDATGGAGVHFEAPQHNSDSSWARMSMVPATTSMCSAENADSLPLRSTAVRNRRAVFLSPGVSSTRPVA